MRAQYASFPPIPTPSEWSIAVETGGNSSISSTRYFWLTKVNRVGRSLLSASKSVVINAGDKVVITFNESIVKAGEDPFWFMVSSSHTDDPTTAIQLAAFVYKNEDGVSTEQLPATIELSEDAHLEIDNLNVPTGTDLPNTPDLINGMVRIVDADSKIYYYNEGADEWHLHLFPDQISYQTNTDVAYGADQLIGVAPLFLPPKKELGVDSAPVRYWLLNGFDEGGTQVSEGQSLNFIISVNGETYSEISGRKTWFNELFDGLIKFQLVGYYRYLNGAFNDTIDLAGVQQTWSPLSVPKSILTLTADLPSGWAAVVDVWLSFDEIILANRGLKCDDLIGIDFDLPRLTSTPSPLTNALGDNIIFARDDRALVLPSKIFAGKGIVKGQDVVIEQQSLEGIAADTDSQLVVIDAIGSRVYVKQASDEILTTQAVRASFSTTGGRTNPSPFSNAVSLTAGQSLSVTIPHPVIGNRGTVRGDYPDPLIASSTLAFWDNPSMRIGVLVDGVLYEQNSLVTSDTSSSQTIVIDSLDDFVQVPYFPQASDDFGLFAPAAATIEGTGNTSSLSAGEYKFIWCYEYPAPNTKITKLVHDPTTLSSLTSACVLETMQGNFTDLAKPPLWSDRVLSSVDDAKSLSSTELEPCRVWLLGSKKIPYYYDPNETGTEDGVTIIRPNSIATGALVPLQTLSLKVADAFTSFKPRSTLKIGSGLSVTEDILGDAIVITLDSSAIVPTESIEPLYTSDGGVLQGSGGEVIK